MENCDYSKEKCVIEYLSNITSDTTHTTTSDTTPATNVDESSKDNTMENENESSNEPTLSDEGSKIAAAYLIFGFMGIGLAILFACFYYHDFDFKLVSLAVLTFGLALVVICMELGSTNKINNCETTSNGTNHTDDVAQAKISKNGNTVIQYPELQNILDQIEKKLNSGYEFRSITKIVSKMTALTIVFILVALACYFSKSMFLTVLVGSMVSPILTVRFYFLLFDLERTLKRRKSDVDGNG